MNGPHGQTGERPATRVPAPQGARMRGSVIWANSWRSLVAVRVPLVGISLLACVLVGDLRRCEPAPEDGPRLLHVRVVEEGRPDHGVAHAWVDVWALGLVPSGGGAHRNGHLLPLAQAQTDADGLASFARIAGPAVYVHVRAPGFMMARRTIPAPVGDRPRVEVALARGEVVAGTVRSADGAPVHGVLVRGSQPGQWGWVEGTHEVVTDPLGRFEIPGLCPGWVTLRAVRHEGDGVWVSEEIVAAGRADATVRLPAEPTRRRLTLIVRGADGAPVAAALCDSQGGTSLVPSLVNGRVELPADPGIQWISISHPRGEDNRRLPWAPIVVGPLGARGGVLEVVMPEGVTLSGTVRDEHGRPLPATRVGVRSLFTDGGIEQSAVEGSFAVSDAEGRFEVSRVPPGRVEVQPRKEGWDASAIRTSAPTSPLDFVMLRQPRVRGTIRYSDGTPAPKAVLYWRATGAVTDRWMAEHVRPDGHFSVWTLDRGAIQLRAGLRPSGVADLAASELTVEPGPASEAIVLTVPRGPRLRVRVEGWPHFEAGAVRVTNGSTSRGTSAWILGDTATFEEVDPRLPVAVYGGPLPDGRIAYATGISPTDVRVTVPLIASLTIRGRARGFPPEARLVWAWADTEAFAAPGTLGPAGEFMIRGIPPGLCRVRVAFWWGKEWWAGSVRNVNPAVPVPLDVEVQEMDEAAFSDWLADRPPPS